MTFVILNLLRCIVSDPKPIPFNYSVFLSPLAIVLRMQFFHLSVLCDGSHSLVNGDEGVAGIGVVIKLVNSDNITDEYPLLYAWNTLRSSPSRPDLAERQAILFASVLSNHVILRRRICQICRPGNLLSATIFNDCRGAVHHVQTNIRNGGHFAELLHSFKDYYLCDLGIE